MKEKPLGRNRLKFPAKKKNFLENSSKMDLEIEYRMRVAAQRKFIVEMNVSVCC